MTDTKNKETAPAPESGGVRLPNTVGVPAGSTADYAVRYCQLGWHVFPVHSVKAGRCTCGDEDCGRPGKHPIKRYANHGLLNATNQAILVGAWFQEAPWANIGIRTGQASGIAVIDFDVEGGGLDTFDQWQDAHGDFDTVEALTGGGGRHLVFEYPEGYNFRNTQKGGATLAPGVDTRGEEGYIVVEPSAHVSGGAYAWEASSDPLEGKKPASMPGWLFDLWLSYEIARGNEKAPGSREAAHAAGDTYVEPVAFPVAAGAPMPAQTGQPAPENFLDPERVLEIRSALRFIDPQTYDVWVKVGMALHSTGADRQGFALWDEWSASDQSGKYNPQAIPKKWASFKKDEGPKAVNIETVFALAQQAGWVNPKSKLAEEHDRQVEAFAKAERDEKVAILPEPERVRRPFPVPALEGLAQWLPSAFPGTFTAVNDHVVMAIAATAAARGYESPKGDPAHIHLGVCAPTLGAVNYAASAARDVVAEAGYRQLIRGTRLATPQGVYQTLMRQPASLFATEEWGAMLTFARRQVSGVQEQAIGIIARSFNGRPVHLDSQADLGPRPGGGDDHQPTIFQPSMTVLGLLSDEDMVMALRREETGRGTIGNMLFCEVEAGDQPLQLTGDVPAALPGWLAEQFTAVKQATIGSGDLAGVTSSMGAVRVHPRIVGWDPKLTEPHETAALERAVRTKPGPKGQALGFAMQGVVRRLCVILSAWANPAEPTLTQDLADYAGWFVINNLDHLLQRWHVLGSDDGKPSAYQRALDVIVRAGRSGVTERELTQQCWAFRKLNKEKRAELIDLLLDDGEVSLVKVTNVTGRGRNRQVFVHSSLTEKVKPAS